MEQRERLLDRSQKPTTGSVAAFTGSEAAVLWSRLLGFIESNYPGVFDSDWLYGGAKHGWSLRFRKSKSFCTLIPERDRMRVLIVFGAREREKVRDLLPGLTSQVREGYLGATTYHDGRWVVFDGDSDAVLRDVETMLKVKRRPLASRWR